MVGTLHCDFNGSIANMVVGQEFIPIDNSELHLEQSPMWVI